MLTYDPATDTSPVQKLLYMVLLMAVRDGASAVRFEPCGETLGIWYFTESVWYELVPVPANLWPDLRTTVLAAADTRPLGTPSPWREVSNNIARDLAGLPWLPAKPRRWWQRQPGPTWVGGWLDHQAGERVVRWAVVLDDRRGRESLLFSSAHPAGPAGDAGDLLRAILPRPSPTVTAN